MNSSERKIVLITGARSGIGRACADALVAQGHQVFWYESYPTVGDLRFHILADGCR
jgi:nucleoside-diphosphate-sugar epimerase